MLQRKEQGKNPEDKISEEEMGNLPKIIESNESKYSRRFWK